MVPLQTTAGQTGFPSGYEHLDANRLLEGYSDHGEYAEWTAGLETSPNDDCKYRLIKLKNGIECILVHSPNAETCAASMAVRVGHLQDPEELPGLAHFLEHLLFMGSAKYPGENEYADYLGKFGGWSNAYTSTDQTVYYFENTHAGFEGTLDRFAQFFVSPLFNENCVEKEIKAVDSEHQKNLQDDTWRLHQLRRSLSRSDHPYHKFGTGNLQTLGTKPRAQGINIRDELIKFYEKHYSANLMKLCIISSEHLDTTLSKTLQFFNEVPNRNRPPTIFPADPYPESLHMTRISMKQLKDNSRLLLQMPFYESFGKPGSKPASLLSYILSNKGPNSLFGFLKKKGLVIYVEAYPFTSAPGIHQFVLECGLTHEGVKQHQLVASTAYEYIKLLKSRPFPSWVFRELRQILQMEFRFLEARSSVAKSAVAASVALQGFTPRDQVFSGRYNLTDSSEESVKSALTYLVKDKVQVIVASPLGIEGLTYNEREQWYGTEYEITPLKEDWFEKSPLGVEERLSLPDENQFIPNNLELVGQRNASRPFPRPLLVKQTAGQRIWFKQDDRWKVPKGSLFIKLSNPFMSSSYKNAIFCSSYLYLVNDALEKYADDAAAAGLHYQVGHHQQDLTIRVFGFTDKLPKLLKLVLHTLKDLRIDQATFDLMKEEKLKALENQIHDKPLDQASSELSWILHAAGSTFEQRQEVLSSVKPEDITGFAKELLSGFYTEALCHGNFSKTTMFELVSMVEEILDYSRLPRTAIPSRCSRVIPENSNYVVRMASSNKEETNNAIRYYMSVGCPNDQDLWVRLILLKTLIAEPCFNTLRTKEQLGYIVGSDAVAGWSDCGLTIVVQSARSPLHLELRINAFLRNFAGVLEHMDLEKFESAKNGLITNYIEDYKNQRSESETYWAHISGGLYDFFQPERIISLVKPLSLRDVQGFFMRYIHPESAGRAKVSVHLYSHRVHSTSIDNLVRVLQDHKVDSEPIEAAVRDQPLPNILHDIVAKHIKATAPDLHSCCIEEILREVDILDEFPDLKKDLPDVKVISSEVLKHALPIGKPRKPFGEFYDGVAHL